MTEWRRVPKVELHLHLEGAAPPDFIRGLGAEKGVDVAAAFDGADGYRWHDFAEFLATYELACSVLRDPDDFRRLVEAVLERSARQGVIYTEIFLAPDLCGDGSAEAWPEYLAAMDEGAAAAEKEHGIVCRFIPTAIRHFGAERAVNAARLSAATSGGRVVGFGMGGEERFGVPADYACAFAIAAEAGLGLTVHAGEVCGPESVRAALDALPVSRIGHGVRAVEDPELVARIVDEAIVLEVCPGSNIALGLYGDLEAHPIARLREAGCRVTVSTDDPPYFRTDMTGEYAGLARAFGWTATDFAALNKTAIEAAFCEAEVKAALRKRLESEVP